MSADVVPTLEPDLTYELCPACEDKGDGYCLTCFDEGLVPHGCPEADDAEPA
jgi:hypothetical protein